MTPSLTSLGEADSTPGQYVLERTWPGAVGTSWIFTQPLMEIARCWKDIICSPDDKADTFCFHAAQFLPADPPSPPQRVHCPCLPKETALVHLAATSCQCISSTTNYFLSDAVALLQAGGLVVNPKPPLPCWTCPTMSASLRVANASSTALVGLH